MDNTSSDEEWPGQPAWPGQPTWPGKQVTTGASGASASLATATPPKAVQGVLKSLAEPLTNAGWMLGGALQGTEKPSVVDALGAAGGLALAAMPVGPGRANMLAHGVEAAAEEAPNVIRAYHGSPHDFNAFDLSKIGTGEGAQAYGHGLYFAEAEPVAHSYRFVQAPSYLKNGADSFARQAAALAENKGLTGAEAKQYALDVLNKKAMESPASGRQPWFDAMNNYDTLVGSPQTPGHMYEVGIKAHPDEFLDWDKPLSEQSPQVRAAYQKLTGAPDPSDSANKVRLIEKQMAELAEDRDPVTNRMTNEAQWHKLARERDAAWNQWNNAQSGGKFYQNLPKTTYSIRDNPADRWRASGASTFEDALKLVGGDKSRVLQVNTPGKEIATQRLRDAGIKGIKYLDQGSRGGGKGTSNFVVFDDKLVDIIKKYGMAGLIAGGAYHFQKGNDGT